MANLPMLVKVASLQSYDPSAAQLLLNLDKAETGLEIIEALERYDQEVSASS